MQYNEDIVYFNAAVKLDSNYADSYYNRGICYTYLFKSNRVIEDFDTAIKLQPNFLAAYHERASIYIAVGEYGIALKDINFALKLDSKNKNTLSIRKILLETIN